MIWGCPRWRAARLDEEEAWKIKAKAAANTVLEAIGRQSSAVSLLTGREKRTRKPLKRRSADVRKRRGRAASTDRLREADQLLRGDDEYAEHQVQEHLLVPAHPDRASAVRVLQHPEHALHASAPSVPEGFCPCMVPLRPRFSARHAARAFEPMSSPAKSLKARENCDS